MVTYYSSKIFYDNPEMNITLVTSKHTDRPLHTHYDYCEFFMITNGSCTHLINGQKHNLKKGSLCIIYKEDVHCIETVSPDFQMLNVCFSEENLFSCISFLGISKESFDLVHATPFVFLSDIFLHDTMKRLLNIKISYNQFSLPRLKCVLCDLVTTSTQYISTKSEDGVPFWLILACEEMRRLENFIEGIVAFVKISGKSQEHLTRAMKKFYNLTPTEYINSLRLEHASKLIITTDKKIIDIIYETGFNNSSHFNDEFKKKYFVPAREYRKLHHSNMVS